MTQTAKEFLNRKESVPLLISDIMIEFAKIHVKLALEKASYEAYLYADSRVGECEINDSITESYPLENIK